MSLSPEAIAKIATEAALAAVAASEGGAEKPARAAKDVAKKATYVRKMDPIQVESGDVTFTVLAHSASGAPYSRGARVVGSVDGKASRSLDLAMVTALQGDGVLDQIREAIATVNKRAMLAEHQPKKEAAAS